MNELTQGLTWNLPREQARLRSMMSMLFNDLPSVQGDENATRAAHGCRHHALVDIGHPSHQSWWGLATRVVDFPRSAVNPPSRVCDRGRPMPWCESASVGDEAGAFSRRRSARSPSTRVPEEIAALVRPHAITLRGHGQRSGAAIVPPHCYFLSARSLQWTLTPPERPHQ
jgi:hypothetical protein